jgi:hypothetical protein
VPVGLDADRGEDRDIADHTAVAELLITGIQQQVTNLAELAAAPGLQLGIEQRRGAADLGGREAPEAELGHDLGGVAGGDALHIHLGEGQHDGAAGPPSPFKGL